MDILNVQCFPGRNVYSHKPVIKAHLDIGSLYDTPSRDIPEFNPFLLLTFPGLQNHFCSCGYKGGFVERLEEGTYLTHITEHLTLELQSMMGYEVYYGKSRLLKEPSVYSMIFEFKNEKLAIECLRAAVEVVDALIAGKKPDMDRILSALHKVCSETELGPSTRALFVEAKRRNIPVQRVCNEGILQFGYGKNARWMEASLTDTPNCISVDMAGNKQLTKELLSGYDIPVPPGDIAYTEQSAVKIASRIGYPVVVKPFDANQGKGVTLDIASGEEVSAAYREAIKFSRAVIVERFVKGNDYRILVVGDRISAVSERKPPFVTGDGKHTVKELIHKENCNPLRGQDHEKPLTKIKLDDIAMKVLGKIGMDENSVPEAGQRIYLRCNGNLSTGGTARDCTDEIHPDNAALAVKAAQILGLDVAGIDLTAEDISHSIKDGSGVVIEVNAAPGLRMHLYPTEGNARNVAADILDLLYPGGKPSTIPIISITGTNGKTTTTRLIAHTLGLAGLTVGMTTTSGVYVGNECILKGDNTGPASARMVLSDKNVEAAVLETARGGIIKRGLGYDLADVGVIVNIGEDHLGLDGAETVEDIAFVKSLVAEAVKEGGYAVLNAEDAMTPYVLSRIRCKLFLFSRDADNLLLLNHIRAGGSAMYIKSGVIHISHLGIEQNLVKVNEIPITMDGFAECNIENSLAAASALYAAGVGPSVIRNGLTTFLPDMVSNPGRFNIFDMGSFKVMLDYGHNPAGFKAVIDSIGKLNASRYIGVIGMPGDRTDKSIREGGVVCGSWFSRIYVKEDRDLRGRKPGEVAALLYEGVMEAGQKREHVSMIHSELEALKTAIMAAQPGDFIVMFYEEFEPALELVRKMQQGMLAESAEGEEQPVEQTAG